MFDWYPQAEAPLSQTQLVLFMLGMGATLTAADFAAIARRPLSLLVGGACQFLLTPLIAVLVNHAFDVPAGIAVGIILVAAMPGGTLSKVFAYLGRGNIALSISLTICGTFASMFTVPLLLRLLAMEYVPPGFEMPIGRIMGEIGLFLLLPLGVGMTVGRQAPAASRGFSRWCIRLGFVVVVVMVTGSLGSGRIQPDAYGWATPLAIIFFCLGSQQLSMLPFRLRGWARPDCLSVGMEVTMRNLNLAFLLKALLFPEPQAGVNGGLGAALAFLIKPTLFPEPPPTALLDPVGAGVLFVILFYAATAMCCGAPLALRHRLKARRQAAHDTASISPFQSDSVGEPGAHAPGG
jgi:BASS family bile acid:Na+ symporter